MRLIDFDKLIELYSHYFYNYTINELKEIREDNMPFIEAIPIEWIKKWLKDHDTESICWLLEDWRKENG